MDWLVPRDEQQLKKLIDTSILFLPIDAFDENFAKICKADEELKQLLQMEFEKQEKACKRATQLRKWWNDLRTSFGE